MSLSQSKHRINSFQRESFCAVIAIIMLKDFSVLNEECSSKNLGCVIDFYEHCTITMVPLLQTMLYGRPFVPRTCTFSCYSRLHSVIHLHKRLAWIIQEMMTDFCYDVTAFLQYPHLLLCCTIQYTVQYCTIPCRHPVQGDISSWFS